MAHSLKLLLMYISHDSSIYDVFIANSDNCIIQVQYFTICPLVLCSFWAELRLLDGLIQCHSIFHVFLLNQKREQIDRSIDRSIDIDIPFRQKMVWSNVVLSTAWPSEAVLTE